MGRVGTDCKAKDLARYLLVFPLRTGWGYSYRELGRFRRSGETLRWMEYINQRYVDQGREPELWHVDAAGLADPPEIVAHEVDDHHVLGAVLLRGGEIGDLITLRAYRMGGRACTCGLKPDSMTEVLHQIKKFHSFLWGSGGMYSDFYIHQIDECSWMKNDWPEKAQASGGRHYRGEFVDQNLDNYSVEYTYPDGTKLFFFGRCISGCHTEFASYAHGTQGSAIITTARHTPGKVRTFKGQDFDNEADLLWAYPQPEESPYQLEWNDLIDAPPHTGNIVHVRSTNA